MNKTVNKPVFFIGAPRSGTTITFEIFSRHPDLAWLSTLSQAFPKMTWMNILIRLIDNKYIKIRGANPQHYSIKLLNRYVPRPTEGYVFWDFITNTEFSRDYLLDKQASNEVAYRVQNVIEKIVSYRGKKRFATKLTGPGRISYLNSIFPDAIFIHIIRDGRSVTDSLMKVDFWQNMKFEPWWKNGLEKKDLQMWEKSDFNPYALTAVQWNKIIETTQHEGKKLLNSDSRYLEIKYEDFIQSPEVILKKIFTFCELDTSEQVVEKCFEDIELRSGFDKKYLKDMDEKTIEMISDIMREKMRELNYSI